MPKLRPLDVCILVFVLFYSLFPGYLGMRVAGVIFNVPRALTILMIALIFIELAANKGTIPRVLRVFRRSSGTVLLIAGYLSFRFASAFMSEDASVSFNAAVSEIIVSIVFLYIGIFFVRALDKFDTLIFVLMFAVGLVCAIGLVEAALQRNVVAAAFPMMEVTDDDYLRIALVEKLRGTHRVQSTFFHPLSFASYLILLMPLAIYCLQRATRTIVKVSLIALIGMMGFDAFYTGSRAALLVMGIIGLVYWIRHSVRLLNQRPYVKRAIGITYLSIILAVTACAAPLAQHLVKGQNEDERSSSTARVVQLEKGGEAIIDYPVLGVGPRMAGRFAGIKVPNGDTVDNWYLTVAVESGLGALVCFVGILTAIFRTGRRLIASHPHSTRIKQLSFAIEISIVVFGFFLLILSLHDETFPYVFLLLGGLMSMRDLSIRARLESTIQPAGHPPQRTVVSSHMYAKA